MLDRAGFEQWRAAYDSAGIMETSRPPSALVEEVRHAAIVAASDLPRAQASAARLAPGREIVVSTFFREIPLPVPGFMRGSRAPRAVWDVMAHLKWSVEILRGREAPDGALTQARLASAWCSDSCARVAHEGGAVAIVTHGVFRRLLALQLVEDGWRAEGGRRRYVHWSVWRFSRDA